MEKYSSMDEYCKAHEHNDYCNRVNQYVTRGFCQIACRGNWKPFQNSPLDELRAKYRKPLKEKKSDKETISVVIPTCNDDKQYLERTIKSLKDNAVGPIEIIVELDKKNEGMRVLINRGTKKAKGKYVMKIDAHCAMSPEWDARMKASCGPNTIVKPMIDSLDVDTWKGMGKDMGFISLNPEMRNEHLVGWKPLQDRKIEEETLSMLGCCYLMEKQYFDKFGGCNESLGKWGVLGVEWAFNTWLTGGRLIVRTDSVCYHYFRFVKPFEIDENEMNEKYRFLGRKWRDGLSEGQTKPLSWLLNKFSPFLNSQMRVAPRDQRTITNYCKK